MSNLDYKEGRGDYYRAEGLREDRHRLLVAARFMADLVDLVYGTDNDGMGLPEEAEYRKHRAVIDEAHRRFFEAGGRLR